MAAMDYASGRDGLVTGSSLVMRDEEGRALPLEPSRWHGPTTPEERILLAGVGGPVLDVGCGPGRVLDALARQGVAALGVDPAPAAAALARRKGCAVLQRSVFDPLPGTGRWETILLLDGNLGIGGDPRQLLERCAALLRPGGTIIAEVEAPGSGWRSCRARLEREQHAGAWFPWAVVGCDAVDAIAGAAGLTVFQVRELEGRWIVWLEHAAVGRDACA